MRIALILRAFSVGACVWMCACSSTVIKVEPLPPIPLRADPEATHRRRPDDGASLVVNTHSEGPVIQGELRWAGNCRPGLIQESARLLRGVRHPSHAKNAFWMAAGSGMLVGGGALVATSWGGSETTKASRVPPGIGLLAGGVMSLFASVKIELDGDVPAYQLTAQEHSFSTLPGGPVEPCGSPRDLERVGLAISIDEGRALPISQDGARFSYVLSAPLQASSKATIVTMSAFPAKVDEASMEIVREGERLATIDLAGASAYLANPPATKFSGKFISTEPAVTVSACRPRGVETCNGIDDDCDGFLDLSCGAHPGALQWTLSYEGDPVTLNVTDPMGSMVTSAHPTRDGSALVRQQVCWSREERERRCTPLQNVYTPMTNATLEGTYVAEVTAARAESGWMPGTIYGSLSMRVAGASYFAKVVLRAKNAWTTRIVFAIGDDRDGDGVIDREDECPDEPGRWERNTGKLGCPARVTRK
jgi:hypothetical protein